MKTQIDKLIKYCRICNCKLILGDNWLEAKKNNYDYICKSCYNDYTKHYGKSWRKENPNHNNDWVKKNLDKNKATRSNWFKKNPNKVDEYSDKHRELGNTFLFDNPFPDNIPVVGHHISDGFKVYIPKSLHLNHFHGRYKQLHRDELQPYVEGIYDINYVIE